MRPPVPRPISFILCSFQQKKSQITGFRPKLRGWRPYPRLGNPGSATDNNAYTNSWQCPRCNLREDLGTSQRIFPHWTWRRRNQRYHSLHHLDLPGCLHCIPSLESHFLSRLSRIK